MSMLTPLILYLYYVDVIGMNLQTLFGSIVFIVISSFFANMTRHCGKQVEYELFEKLGGPPTSIVLSYSDSHLNSVKKNRYHNILQGLMPELKIPMSLGEEGEDIVDLYDACATKLRGKANAEREHYPIVYANLIKYSFWRNMIGLRKYSIVLYLCTLSFEIYRLSLMQNVVIGDLWPVTGLVCALGFVIFKLNLNFLEPMAFEYAISLVEICENQY